MIEAVLFGRTVETAGRAGGLFKIRRTFLVRISLCAVDELPRFDRNEFRAEGVHHFRIERSAEAEPLRRVPDCGDSEIAHCMLQGCRRDRRVQFFFDAILFRCAEHIGERTVAECAERICRGVCAGQRIQAQPTAVDDRFSERPQDDGAVDAAQHFAHVGGVGKGQVLKHDEVRRKRLKERFERVDRKQLFLRADEARIERMEHIAGADERVFRAFHMKGRYADRNINRGEWLHSFSSSESFHAFEQS